MIPPYIPPVPMRTPPWLRDKAQRIFDDAMADIRVGNVNRARVALTWFKRLPRWFYLQFTRSRVIFIDDLTSTAPGRLTRELAKRVLP